VNHSGECIDVPWAETQNVGFAFQACKIYDVLATFSELEYYVPAVGPPERNSRSEDRSQLCAFRDQSGPSDRLRDGCFRQKLDERPTFTK
jgi:hypothetical protein